MRDNSKLSTEDSAGKDWCPTMNGQTFAYEAQFRGGMYVQKKRVWDDWAHIPTQPTHPGQGAPFPLFNGGVLQTVGLHGREQAMALAWQYAAQAEATGVMVETRVVVYELHYNIKARVQEGNEIPCSTHRE